MIVRAAAETPERTRADGVVMRDFFGDAVPAGHWGFHGSRVLSPGVRGAARLAHGRRVRLRAQRLHDLRIGRGRASYARR